MFKSLWEGVKDMFSKISETNSTQAGINESFADQYREVDEINFTSIIANKIANLVKDESEIIISDDFAEPSQRTLLLRDISNRVWRKNKKIVTRMLGTGGVALIPYVANGRLQADIIQQDRFFINEKIGDDIMNVTILAECVKIDDDKYYRWVNYELDENKVCRIRTYATKDQDKVSLSTVPAWKSIEPEIAITECEKPLLSFMRCPIDNKTEDEKYGVPITYGCDDIIEQIKECLAQITQEYNLKQAFLGIDDRLLRDGELPSGGLFRKVKSSGGAAKDFWEVFDPAIRDSSYYVRLTELFSLLEKAIGTSKGILTEKTSNYATATEIKNSNNDTYSIVNDTRLELEAGFSDFLYACDVLIDYYNLAPVGEYNFSFNWGYGLIENTSETWEQMLSAEERGAIKTAELRQYLVSDESLEESEMIVEEIKKNKMEEQTSFEEDEEALEDDEEKTDSTTYRQSAKEQPNKDKKWSNKKGMEEK